DAGVEIESLTHGHDGTEVRVPLALELRPKFVLRLFFRLRRNRAKQSQLVLGQQINGALWQGVALFAPALPADVGVNVLGIKPDSLKNPQSFGENLIPDSISRHGDDCVF